MRNSKLRSKLTSGTKRKRVLEAMRRVLRPDLRRSEAKPFDPGLSGVIDEAVDRVIDEAVRGEQPGQIFLPQDRVTCGPSVPHIRRTDKAKRRRISPAGIALIKRFEGCARLRRDGMVEAYPDPGTGGEPWTIGWGATGSGLELGSRIGPSTVWTQEQCDARLADDLARYAREVAQAIGDAPTRQAQFDAMVSFHYNTGAISRATLTKKHVAGDYEGAADEFKRWNQAGGRVLKGLVRRRAEEERLYRDAR